MCGIAGILQNKGGNSKKLEEAVKKMNDVQMRRGPDDEGIFLELVGKRGVVALGHRRLSILDLSKKGKQPMSFSYSANTLLSSKPNNSITDNLITITYNGEIYNFLELKKELKSKGYKFKTQTDTEVVLALYVEYGENSFGMLRGMFAFAIWDGERGRIFLVKDRYGVKPLYYYSDKEKLIFASTVGAIKKSGLVELSKNEKALTSFLLFGSVNLPMPTYKEISAIEPGHYLERDIDGNEKLKKYYDPLKHFLNKSGDNFDLAKEKISKLLNDSVEKHLISDAPLGVFLSGGLDSSAIAALSAEALREGGFGRKITTLSIIFEEEEFSEEYYSDLVAKKINSDHRKIKITKQDFYDSFEEIFEAMDQPTIDGVNTFFVAKVAKEAGLKTVLSGLGSDEIFMGYPFFKKAGMLASLWKSPKIFKNLAFYGLKNKFPKIEYIKNEKLNYYPAIRGIFSPSEVSKILGTNQKEINNFLEEIFSKQIDEGAYYLAPEDMISYFELKFYLQNQLLKDTDFMSMHHSIEVRVPFLDHFLVEYLSGLDAKVKLRGKVIKPLLTEVVRGIVPDEILSRDKKMGFTFPFQKWLLQAPKGAISNFPACAEPACRQGRASAGRQFPISKEPHWSRFWATIVLDKYL